MQESKLAEISLKWAKMSSSKLEYAKVRQNQTKIS